MANTLTSDLFALVPEEWFEPIAGLWVVVIALLGTELTLSGVATVLAPLGSSTAGAVLVTTAAATLAYGIFAFGLSYVYLEQRGVGPGVVLDLADRAAWRWIAGLGVLALVLLVTVGAWHTMGTRSQLFRILPSAIVFGSPPFPDGWAQLSGLRWVVLPFLTAVVIGPAVGAVFHGVLQNTLSRVAPPAVALGGPALATALTVVYFTYPSVILTPLLRRTFAVAFVTFAFALAVGIAYRRTDNLLVPLAAYGLFNLVAGVLVFTRIEARMPLPQEATSGGE